MTYDSSSMDAIHLAGVVELCKHVVHKHLKTSDVWRSMTEVQRQRSRNVCFGWQGGQTSVSTDGELTVT